MAIEIKKLQDLEYNELITLGVIEGDKILTKKYCGCAGEKAQPESNEKSN